MKRFVLLDSNAIVHRAFHALPGLTAPDGRPTNAVYGFTTILLKIIDELKPDYIAAAFDLAAPTFRHVAFERYKATRVKAPDELYAQFPLVKEILSALSIPIYEKEGYEADDVIGTLARTFEKKYPKDETVIVTGDLDTLQLVSKRIKVFTMRKGITDTVLYDEAGVKERFGFPPKFVIDYKGLRGDPSDNIPGVKGIGEKTATELIKKFGAIESIYKHIKEVSPEGVRTKLESEKDEALFSKELATIHTKVPLDFSLKGMEWKGDVRQNEKVRTIFQQLGFFSLVKRLDMPGAQAPAPAKKERAEGSEKSAQWTALESEDEAKKFVAVAAKEGIVALGIFPTGEVFMGLVPGYAVYCALPSGSAWCVPESSIANLKGFFENSGVKKIAFDAKRLAESLRARGIFLRGVSFDAVLARYILSPHEKEYEPSTVAKDMLKKKITKPEDIVPHLFALEKAYAGKFKGTRLSSVLHDIELPLVPFLSEMEYWGITVDAKRLAELSSSVGKRVSALEKKICDYAGEDFNVNSPSQLSKILFEKLNLMQKGLRKTAGGAQSTQASELAKLQGKHPIIDAILEYRELQKLKTTYIDALPALIRSEDGRIHTTFNQVGTVTGRLSSSNPNLQNIPTRSELGKKIREAFVPEKGYVFAAFDYSQIELRVAAHMSGDKKMIEAFKKGIDIHAMTASEVEHVPIDKITPELRREAKTLNFGVLYGMGARSFAESSGFSREKAKQFIEEYFRRFSSLRAFLDGLKEFAHANGYVETIFGRRRPMPELKSPYILIRLEGERMAINMPLQGTAADILKIAMNKISEKILASASRDEIRPILQVHDELIFEIKKGSEKKYVDKIKDVMEGAAELKVPLVVDEKIADNWGDL